MYDRYSLEQLFLNAGLTNTSVETPAASRYAGWKQVNLDVSARWTARPAARSDHGGDSRGVDMIGTSQPRSVMAAIAGMWII